MTHDFRSSRSSRSPRGAKADPERLPPSSSEAEQGVLGCIMLAPKDCLIECAERWGGTPVFYDLRHQVIYDACQRLNGRSAAVDLITLVEELKGSGDLERVGGPAMLAQLSNNVPHQSHLAHYAGIVWSHYQRRQAIAAAAEITVAAYEGGGDADELLTKFEERIFALPRARQRGARPIAGCIDRVIDRIEHYSRGIGTLTGLPTGFRYWDRLAAGLQNNELIVIGGRPGTGKTSLAMNIAERVAMDGKNPVGIQSMEMSEDDLTLRLTCARVRVNFHKLRTGCATNEELEKLARAMPRVKDAPIYIDDETSLTIFDIRSRLRAMKQRFGIRLAIVDYLQLAVLPPEFRGDTVRGYGEVAKGLMSAAKELGIPIILLSQLSREGEKRGGRPRMSDLRESGDIEACAHFIGILYRESLDKAEEDEQRDKIHEDPLCEIRLKMLMEVCKNRNGPSGTSVQFDFLRWCMRFEDRHNPSRDPEAPQKQKSRAKIDPEDVPLWGKENNG